MLIAHVENRISGDLLFFLRKRLNLDSCCRLLSVFKKFIKRHPKNVWRKLESPTGKFRIQKTKIGIKIRLIWRFKEL